MIGDCSVPRGTGLFFCMYSIEYLAVTILRNAGYHLFIL